MLAVNVKRSETLDWTGLLTTFISDNYSEKESKDSFAQIQAMCDLRLLLIYVIILRLFSLSNLLFFNSHTQRQRLTQLFYQTIDATTDVEPIFQSALEYCSLLKALGKRFPFAESPVSRDSGGISAFFGLSVKPRTKVTALAANFLWFDAFHREKQSRSCSVEFERAAVLFNAASALSFSAIWADRSTDDGLKKAMKLLQRAAGVFAFLEEQKLVVERTSTLDLMPESFTMLNAMMLAQAQICVHEIALLKQNSSAALGFTFFLLLFLYSLCVSICCTCSQPNLHLVWRNCLRMPAQPPSDRPTSRSGWQSVVTLMSITSIIKSTIGPP
jgi:hypothetical protein